MCDCKSTSELCEWREFAFKMWLESGEEVRILENRILELEDENQRLSELVTEQNRVLEYYPQSLSWRVTAPLRAMRKAKA
jgi:hypothetical protein